jgi:hypothetical protein
MNWNKYPDTKPKREGYFLIYIEVPIIAEKIEKRMKVEYFFIEDNKFRDENKFYEVKYWRELPEEPENTKD